MPAAANIPRITPHRAIQVAKEAEGKMKLLIAYDDQVKRQQDATDEWARRTGKSAPPYQFEDFIGKGAYGRESFPTKSSPKTKSRENLLHLTSLRTSSERVLMKDWSHAAAENPVASKKILDSNKRR